MTVVIQGYNKATFQAGFVWTNTSASSGWWIVSISGLNGGSATDILTSPGKSFGDGAWQFLGVADAGPNLPKMVAWARPITESGKYNVGVAGSGSLDVHGHMYVLSGLRDSTDALTVFSVGSASSETAGTAQEVPLYAPGDSGLLIGAWMSGGLVDYSMPGGFTAHAELDGSSSTSHAGEQMISVHGPSMRTATASAAQPWAALTIIARDDLGPVTFPVQPLGGRVELALGADPGADPVTWAALWTDTTDDVNLRDSIAITRGRADEASTISPSTMSMTLNNTAGKYVRLNPNSPYYGKLSKNTPIRFWVNPGTGWELRYTGFVSEWPPRSQGQQIDEHMPVVAAGITRRLSRGRALQSPLYRAVSTKLPFNAYWPLEDGTLATQAASAAPGIPAMRVSGPVNFGDAGAPAGAVSGVSFGTGGSLYGVVPGMPTGQSWMISWWLDIPADFNTASDNSPLVDWRTPGSSVNVKWVCYVAPGSGGAVVLAGYADNDVVQSAPGVTDIRGKGPTLITAHGYLSGSDVLFDLYVNGVSEGGNGHPETSISPITTVGINDFFSATDSTKGSVSSLIVATHALGDTAALTTHMNVLLQAGRGYAGERATDRIWRLSDEEGMPVAVIGDDGASEPMGSQGAVSFLDLLRDCESTDGGLLYELRDGRLAYQARAARYNATPSLTLDYAQGHVAPPLEPTDDDQRVRNDVEVSRTQGSSARVTDEASVIDVGRYGDSVTVNVADDDQLADHAGWLVHLGTNDDLRYPAIAPNLNGKPTDLMPSWANLDVGQAVAITNPGRDLPPGQIDLFAEGYSETIDAVSWNATINCSPGRPWKVGVLDDVVVGRLDTAGSQLSAGVSLPSLGNDVLEGFEDASLNVTITGGGSLPWARTIAAAHTGSWSLRSGVITSNQTSDAIVTIPSGAQALTFWYKVSSEATFDFLHVFVDAVEKLTISGEVDWTYSALSVVGASTVTFRYSKDGATDSGLDAAFIDDLRFTTTDSLSVATSAGPLWTTDPTDMPVGITVGGEDMSAVSVSGTSSPQTFAVVRAVNGVVKSHSSGEDVRLSQPLILSL